ncbi:hypothetical protein TorRG33x02_008200 [Trema orientale]|uniref:Retrovirus-related Pol polyprotein from transposon TNT 1-94-like beta-barrel domain-containing protein n=1 Tax=Trema orientale TaxID=63057 RepID=A0A2P5G0Q4_TREOI|nr:hypothetical protein TorRG33x02_008200 [Trema orientale]
MLLSQEYRTEQSNAIGTVDLSNASANLAYTNGCGGGHTGTQDRDRAGYGHRGTNTLGSRPICQIKVILLCLVGIEWMNPTSFQVHLMATDIVVDPNWYADSGATNHIATGIENLNLATEYGVQEHLIVGNDKSFPITYIGISSLVSQNPSIPLKLFNVLRVPDICKNLISISKLTADNHQINQMLIFGINPKDILPIKCSPRFLSCNAAFRPDDVPLDEIMRRKGSEWRVLRTCYY